MTTMQAMTTMCTAAWVDVLTGPPLRAACAGTGASVRPGAPMPADAVLCGVDAPWARDEARNEPLLQPTGDGAVRGDNVRPDLAAPAAVPMRRADRLFQLVQLIRGRRLSTAAFLAERLQVSLRTVYRDVADLAAQGVPIEGEAGVGYRMRSGFDLPPLMFTADEAKALVAAVRLAQPRLDAALSQQADSALSKILSVLPPATRAAAESLAVYAPSMGLDEATRSRLEAARVATESRRKLHLRYVDLKDAESERTVRPLGCFFWGHVWTLAAWCEARSGFRSFRVDRIVELRVLDERFRDEPGQTLADMFRAVEADRG